MIIIISLFIGLMPLDARALATSTESQIWWTDINPHNDSDHTRCDVIFAKGTYWLFFDWNTADWINPDIYVMSSLDAVTWEDPVPLVSTSAIENDPRAFVYDGTIYLTYQSGGVIYIMTSTDGVEYSDPRMLYQSPLGGFAAYQDFVYKDGWFYMAYEDGATQAIMVTKSPDLVTWEDPVVAIDTPGPDYTPDICLARGKIWLVWNYNTENGHSHPFIISSEDGITWTEPLLISPPNPTDDVYGPFSLIYDRGKFIFVTRITSDTSLPAWQWPWRMSISTSKDGITWTPFEAVGQDIDVNIYQEKGGTVFPVQNGIREGRTVFSYSIVFKNLMYNIEDSTTIFTYGQLSQVFMNLRPTP